jgi:hypothetical protein
VLKGRGFAEVSVSAREEAAAPAASRAADPGASPRRFVEFSLATRDKRSANP